MTDENRTRGYDAGAMFLHWTIAGAIVLQLVLGFAMTRLDAFGQATRFAAFQWHKTAGVAVLALTLARIAWRIASPPPAHPPMSRIERRAAGAAHLAFYALMLLVPASGWLLVSASPTSIPTLLAMSERLPWPDLPIPAGWRTAGAAGAAGSLHAWLAYSTLGLLVLHVAGALKHSLVDRMPSLSRMLPTGRLPRRPVSATAFSAASCAALAFLAAGVASGGTERVPQASEASAAAGRVEGSTGWVVDRTASSIRFEVTFSGKPVAGTVGRWNAAIDFDPSAPSTGSVRMDVDAASIDVEEPFVRSNVPGPDGFDVGKHPQVTLRVDGFERTASGFSGEGTITVKDRSVPFALPFTYAEEGGRARAKGSVVLDRTALGLGLANDAGAQWLGKDVKVDLDIAATRPAPGS